MRDYDAVVTDTHPLVFHAAGGSRLSRTAARVFARCEAGEAIIYVPVAVVWECRLLSRVGRIDLRRSTRAFFEDLFSNPAYQPVDLTTEHVFGAETLGLTHDPFDALIASAAQTLELPLLTRDGEIQESRAVAIIW